MGRQYFLSEKLKDVMDGLFQSGDDDGGHGCEKAVELRCASEPHVNGGVPLHFIKKHMDTGIDNPDDKFGRIGLEKLLLHILRGRNDFQIQLALGRGDGRSLGAHQRLIIAQPQKAAGLLTVMAGEEIAAQLKIGSCNILL